MSQDSTIGVVLMSFGAAATPDEIPAYLSSVRGGQQVPEQLIVEFKRRYAAIGGSPLLKITRAQAKALETLLNTEFWNDGSSYRVEVGMRHSSPTVTEAFARLSNDGIEQVVPIIMAPQHSPIIMAGYHSAVDQARHQFTEPVKVIMARAWHDTPAFLDALTQRLEEALARLPGTRDQVAVLFSTHSMPKIVVEREPEYTEMLHDTAREVAVRANLKPSQWQLAYQSAAHTPEEWLKPDITDLFPELAGQGHEDVLIVPIQFLADHLEVLYDIDIAARAQAGSFGLRLHRTESFNVMPKFIEALANVVRKELTRDKQQIVSIPNLEGARDENSRG